MVLHMLTVLVAAIQSFFGVPVDMTHPTPALPENVVWATTTAAVVRVIDGDTIDVRLPTGQRSRVRYIGMNTPEIRPQLECGGASSTARNQELVDGKTVILVPGPGRYDKYGRRLAYVYVGDTFVNQELLAEGWAELMMIPPNTAYQSTFEILRNRARSKGAGIWSCPTAGTQ